jgi:hypothetical protein
MNPEATSHLLLIDASEPAYTVCCKLPVEHQGRINREGKDPDLLKLISWDQHLESQEHLRAYIKLDDYGDVDTIGGLTALLDRAPGVPFGLTWSGGIAYTYSDYQHAKRTHAAYLTDPASHKRRERAADPVHPLNHLGPLLGR